MKKKNEQFVFRKANYFLFDEGNASHQKLAKTYPAARRKICIRRTIFMCLMLITLICTIALPFFKIKPQTEKYQTAETTYNLSWLDFYTGYFAVQQDAEPLKEHFIANDGLRLLIQDSDGNWPQATDKQILADVEFKRTQHISKFGRMCSTARYLEVIEWAYYDAKNLPDSTPIQKLEKKMLLEFYDILYPELPTVIDTFAYDIERLNYGGVKAFLSAGTNEFTKKEPNVTWYEEAAEKYLLGTYDEEEIKTWLKNNTSEQTIALKLLPSYRDAYFLRNNSIDDVHVGNTALPKGGMVAVLLFGVFITVLDLAVLIAWFVGSVGLIRYWLYPDRRISQSMYTIPFSLFAASMLLMAPFFNNGRMAMLAIISPIAIFVAALSFAMFIFEIVVNIKISRFTKKYSTNRY